MNNNKRQREEGEEEEKKGDKQQKRTDSGSAAAATSSGAVVSSTAATIPLQLSKAQRLDQHRLHSIFAFLTLHELAAVSGSCRLWRSDASSLKGRSFQLDLKVNDRINVRMQSLARSSVRHHIVSILLNADSSNSNVQLIDPLPLLSVLPSLTGVSLSFDKKKVSTTVASGALLLPLTLLQLKVCMAVSDNQQDESIELLQLFVRAAGRLTSLHTLELSVKGKSKAASLDFLPLLQLSSSLTDLTLSLHHSDPTIFDLCAKLKQMRALKSLHILPAGGTVVRGVATELFTPPHQLQRLEELLWNSIVVYGKELQLLASSNVPSLKHISAWELSLDSIEAVEMLLNHQCSLEVGELFLDLHGATLNENQADALLACSPRLQQLWLHHTPVVSLRCLRFVPDLECLSFNQSTHQLHTEDMDIICALTKLHGLRIAENEPILLTAEVKAALQVPSRRVPTLKQFYSSGTLDQGEGM